MEILVNTEIPARLDRYLRLAYPTFTQGILEQSLRKGLIKVNDKKSQASLRVVDGDKIFISPKISLKETSIELCEFSAATIKLGSNIVNKYQIYSCDDFIAINKPADLAVQGGSKIVLSIDAALKYLNTLSNDFRLVHRLDKDTSGVLLIAKNHAAAFKLTNAFKDRVIKKTYLAIVCGKPKNKEGEISNLIARNQVGMVDVAEHVGKLAITNYKLIKSYGRYSLIEFAPLTGRTHQLRFHAKQLGCPIVGDEKYGNADSREDHMLLHAKQIIVPSELFGQETLIESPLPYYFNDFLKHA